MSQTPLLPLLRRYIEQDPAKAAQMMEGLSEAEVLAVVKALPPTLGSEIVSRLHAQHASAMLKVLPPEVVVAIMDRIKPEQATTLLMGMTPEGRRAVLDLLPDLLKKQIQTILQFPENSAGRIMTTKFIALDKNLMVKDAIARIRTIAHRYGASTYTYVVDEGDRLVGVLNMRDLMLAHGNDAIETVMVREVFAVDGFMDREDVAHKLNERKFLAAPVIDGQRNLIGVVKLDQLLGHIQEESTEDILKMVGAGSEERAFSPISYSYRQRIGWLTFNLATAFLASAVVGLFQNVIARITILAVFLPVVAGQGGNAGAQSLAVVMRGLVMREVKPHQAWKLVLKESVVGFLNGVSIGIITALVAWWWHGNPYLGLVIGLAMVCNLVVAGLTGAAIPLTMKACGWDPAQSSSIIQTTFTDVCGFFSFLGFAVLFEKYLV